MNKREYLLFGLLDLLLRRGERSTDATALARDLRLSVSEITEGLTHLEGKGLVDLQRVRLTLAGLCVARALSASAATRAVQAA